MDNGKVSWKSCIVPHAVYVYNVYYVYITAVLNYISAPKMNKIAPDISAPIIVGTAVSPVIIEKKHTEFG